MHILFTCRRASGSQHVVKRVDGARNSLTEIVESVEDDVKGLEPLDVELWFLDVRVDRLNTNVWIKGAGRLSCYLGVRS